MKAGAKPKERGEAPKEAGRDEKGDNSTPGTMQQRARPILPEEVDELSARSGLPSLTAVPGLSRLANMLEEKKRVDRSGRAKQLDATVQTLTRALAADAWDIKSRVERAAAYLERGALGPSEALLYFARASADFSRALKLDDTLVEALYQRGIAYQKMGQLDQATRDFTNVLRLEPRHSHAAFARAACQNIMGRFSQAIEDYELGLRHDTSPLSVGNFFSVYNPPDMGEPGTPSGAQPPIMLATPPRSRRQRSGASSSPRRAGTPTRRPEHPGVKKGTNATPNKAAAPRTPQTPQTPRTPRTPQTPRTPSRVKFVGNSGKASQYFHKAVRARQQGRPKNALAFYGESLRHDPTHFRAAFNRAYLLHDLGRLPESVRAYTHALRIDPKSALVFYNRGIAKDKSGDEMGAVQDFTEALRLLDPRGSASSKPRAEMPVDRKLVISLYQNRGVLHSRMKEYERAAADFATALRISPAHVKARMNLARCMERMGRLGDALADYAKALDLVRNTPNCAPLRCRVTMRRIDIFRRVGNTDAALRNVGLARGIVATKSSAWSEAKSLDTIEAEILKQGTKAGRPLIEELTLAIAGRPKDAALYHRRGLAHACLHKYRQATEDFTAAVERLPKPGAAGKRSTSGPGWHTRTRVLLDRAATLQRMGRLENARDDLNDVIKLYPNNVASRQQRAAVLVALGLFELAKDDYESAFKIDRKLISALFNAGVCYEKMQEVKRAVSVYDKLLKVNPRYGPACLRRGLLLKSLGRRHAAEKDIRRARELGADPALVGRARAKLS